MQSRKKCLGIPSVMEGDPTVNPLIECANNLLDLYPDPIHFQEFLLDCYHWLVLHPKSTEGNDLPNVVYLNTEIIRQLVIPRLLASDTNDVADILVNGLKKLYEENGAQAFNDYLNSLYFSLQKDAENCARSCQWQTEITNGLYILGRISSKFLLQEERILH